jgi:cytochrome c-type biogenesis protein CcmF
MFFGQTIIILAGVCATTSLLAYALAGRRPLGIKLGRICFALLGVLVTAAAVYLLYLFLTHRFDFRYVFAYSSLDLPMKYTISSFWGGQEGTFLLWLLFGALLGWAVIARSRHYERWAMVFYLLVQLFLIAVLIVRSPFAPTGFEAADGRGLNPLLQNPWMVIHPPIVFLGFAALAIPFGYAMGSLVVKDYVSFPRLVFPWVAVGVVTLGTGIFLGGYWAYKTLGWGGYWGWDPVENSSLIPWLVALALLHGLLIQKRGPRLVKTNLGLAIFALALVIYGTFLTRSGVLADFSVHSFTDLGINAYLVGFLLLLVTVCPVLLIVRTRSIITEKLDSSPTSRDSGLTLGLLILLATALLVLLGTSAPLLTRLFGDPANVDLSYYQAISIPAGLALLLLLIVVPFTRAGNTAKAELFQRMLWPGVAAAIITIITILLVDLRFADVSLIFLGVWAAGANVLAVLLMPRKTISHMGGRIAHIGLAAMVLGIVASSNYSSVQRVGLQTGVPENVMGYEMTYISRVDAPRLEDSYLNVRLASAGDTIYARPQVFVSEFTNAEMRHPHVVEGPAGDLYLAPLDLQVLEESGGQARLELVRDKPAPFGEYTFTFQTFEMGEHSQEEIAVGARLQVAGPTDTVIAVPRYISGAGGAVRSPEEQVPGTGLRVFLEGIAVENRSVLLRIVDPARANEPGKEVLTLEVTRKPLISLVWLGLVLMTLGASISFFRRWSQLEVRNG